MSIIRHAACRVGIGSWSRVLQTPVFGSPFLPRHVRVVSSKAEESFWDKNKRMERPMSPHLTIYKWEITQSMSIAHRATGLLLSYGVYGFAIGMMLLPGNFPHYMNAIQMMHLPPATVYITKFVLAFPLIFHTCSGMRHMAWDAGKFFKIKNVYATGYAAIAAALAITSIVAAL